MDKTTTVGDLLLIGERVLPCLKGVVAVERKGARLTARLADGRVLTVTVREGRASSDE